MFFRILYLIALIGVVGRDSGAAPRVEVVEPGGPGEEQRMGGEGFGNIVSLVALLGVAILAAIVILAVLALSGQFSNDIIDPPA
ncbi:MAG: hypothetical protein H0W23_08340 [Chloroflexia bacterium]|nr:hypothetical protein [Chloroflexia bacterium]